MKKTTKYILITFVALLVLGGLCAALLLTAPKANEEEASSSSAAPSTSLVSREAADVKSVSIKNPKSQFTILVKGEEVAGTESAEASKKLSYTLEGFEKYSLNTTALESAVKSVCTLAASKDLGEPENLKDFGLVGDTASEVTVNFADGTKEAVTVGGKAGESYGNYVLHNGKVYICSVSTTFTDSMYSTFNPFTYTIADEADDSGAPAYSLLKKLKLTGTNFAEPIDIAFNEDTAEFRMTTPIATDCGTTIVDELTTAFKTLTSSSVVLAGATEADLKQYGLDTPYATAEFTVNKTAHTLSVSEQKVDGNRYMLADGDKTVIYTVAANLVDPWTTLTTFKLRNSYVFLPMIMKVDDFTIEAGGKTCTIDLSRAVNEEKSSDTQTVYDYTATKNGKEIEYKEVTSFYSSMISIAALNTEKLDYSGDAKVKFTFNYYEGGQDVLEYKTANDDRLVALLNGAYSATVRRTSIDEFLTAMDAFLAK